MNNRFGEVLKISPIENDRAIVVHFSSRREAEVALKKGSNVAGQNIKMDWYDDKYTLNSNNQQVDDNFTGDSNVGSSGFGNNNLQEYEQGRVK